MNIHVGDFRRIKRRQLILAFCLGIVVIGVLSSFIWILANEGSIQMAGPDLAKKTDITTAARRINPQEIWVQRMEIEAKLIDKRIKAMELHVTENIKNYMEMKEKLEELRHQLQNAPSKDNGSPSPHPDGDNPETPDPVIQGEQFLPSAEDFGGESGQRGPKVVRKIILNLSKANGRGPLKTKSSVDNTLPAGAYAKGVLLSGVDASTSITSASDPRPVLLRLIDSGNLPRQFKSDLKNCHLLASAYGDLSSERVYMRLEKLTCTEPLTGEISETQVSGYVAGEDGRVGVRGLVADRAGEIMRNSLVGGFLSGMSSFFGAQQQRAIYPISPFGQTNALSAEQMLSSGAAQGTSNALEKYADFFIKRAEQLQPVLQVAAGRKVDIVFSHGVKFGETGVKKAITKVRDRSREAIAQGIETTDIPSGLPQPSLVSENAYE